MNPNSISAFQFLVQSDRPRTTTEVAEAVFDPSDTEEKRNADRKVRYYFDDAYDHLVNVHDGDGPKRYTADDDRVWFGVGRLDMLTVNDYRVSVGFGRVMVYVTEDGSPEVVSLEPADDGDQVDEAFEEYDAGVGEKSIS